MPGLAGAHKIDRAGRKPWCESKHPEFAAKAATLVGLSVAALENAMVILCRREAVGPSAGQALERAKAIRNGLTTEP